MTITSREFKQLIVDFERDLQEIAEGLYEAIEDEISPKAGAAFADRARSKIADYSSLLNDSRFDDLKRSQVAERLESEVDDLRDMIRSYEAKGK